MRTITKVENILAMFPETRSSDKELMLHIWEGQGLYLSPAQQEKFMKATSPETITRVRRKIQQEGKYPATDKVKESRKWKSMRAEQVAPKATPDWLEGILGF